MTALLIVTQFYGQGCNHMTLNSKLNVSFISQALWVIYVLGLCFDVLSMGVCKTRHWQTSGRLVQELHVCTVWESMYVSYVSLLTVK